MVARFLAEHPVRTGWDAESLTVVLIALSNGLALEALPDPDAVPATCSPGCSATSWAPRSAEGQSPDSATRARAPRSRTRERRAVGRGEALVVGQVAEQLAVRR